MRFLTTCLALVAFAAPVALGAEETPADKPKLGVQLEDSAFDPSQGIPVRAVVPGGTAAVLGLLVGDAIKTINGKPIASFADLLAIVSGLKAGDAVSIEVMRQGQPMTLVGKMLAAATPGSITRELKESQEELARLNREVDARKREPTLAELIRELQMLQEQFPKAAAEFKKIYPNGEFSIVIKITSDKTAANPVDLMKDPVPPAPTPLTSPKP